MTEPTILSNAQSDNWIAVFTGLEGVIFKTRNFQIPSVTAGVTELGGSGYISMNMPGDHLMFDELTFDFLVDANYANFRSVFAWLKKNTKANEPDLRECTLHLLNPDGTFRGVSVEFYDCFPMNLAPIMLDAENSDTDVQCSVTIKYSEYDFVDDVDYSAFSNLSTQNEPTSI